MVNAARSSFIFSSFSVIVQRLTERFAYGLAALSLYSSPGFTRCLSCVCLSPCCYNLIPSFTSSHPFNVLLLTIDSFLIALPAVVLSNCSHPYAVVAPALSLSIWYFTVKPIYALQQLGKKALHCRPSLLGDPTPFSFASGASILQPHNFLSVSYTHLTLPTIYSV